MSTAGAFQGLGATLTGDAGLIAWARDNFGATLHLVNGNRPVEIIANGKLPALVLETGPGEGAELVGGQQMETTQEMNGALVWREQDEAAAFVQRLALPEILARALMTDRRLGGQVEGAWLQSWEPDRGANHPLNVFRFKVAAEDFIERV